MIVVVVWWMLQLKNHVELTKFHVVRLPPRGLAPVKKLPSESALLNSSSVLVHEIAITVDKSF